MKKISLLLTSFYFGLCSLNARVPFTHMFHLQEAFEGFEECHPLMGWTALQKNLIHNLRFNGNFEYREKHEDDVPKDAVSKLIKMLFPSPSGILVSFASNKDNLGYVINSKDRRDPDVIAMMLHLVRAQKEVLKTPKGNERKIKEKELAIIRRALEGRDIPCKKDLINNLLNSVKECVGEGKSECKKVLRENDEFIGEKIENLGYKSMVPAAFSQKEKIESDHGPNEDKVSYPPYLVEQILMAFLCDRFDTREDLLSFSKILNQINKQEQSVNEKIRIKGGEDFVLTIKNRTLNVDMPIERYVDSVYGDSFFKALLPYDNKQEAIGYSQTGYYSFDGKKEDVKQTKDTFADCVESTFRQFLNILLFDPKEDKDFKKPLHALKGKVKNTRAFQKLLWFYLGEKTEFDVLNEDNRFPQNSRESVLQKHQSDRFGKVIEDLNSALNTDKMSHVYYRRLEEIGSKGNRFEVDAGPLNTLAVFENLLGLPLGEGGAMIADVRKRAALQQDKKNFFEAQIRSGFKKLFSLFERDNFKIELTDIGEGVYAEGIQDYCGAIFLFSGEIEGKKFSFKIKMNRNHHEIQNVEVLGNEIEKQEIMDLDKAFLQEAPYRLLSSWEKRGKSFLDFYTLYTSSLGNQDECIKLLENLVLDKQNSDKYIPFIKNVIRSIEWGDSDTAQRGLKYLMRLVGMYGNNHDIFEGVKFLNLNGSYIQKMENVDLPIFIEELDLSETFTASLSIGNLKKLKKLNLDKTSIAKINKGDLPESLEELNLLCTRQLETISIGNLNQLTILDLNSSEIKEIDGKYLPESLKELDLSFTSQLGKISIGNLDQLTQLYLGESGIKEIGKKDLPESLKILDLFSMYQLEKISIGHLNQLTKLSLKGSSIKEIGEKDLPESLEILDLSSMYQLEKISIGNLNQLKKLNLKKTEVKREAIVLPQHFAYDMISYD